VKAWKPIRSAFFLVDAETIHHAAMSALKSYSEVCRPAPHDRHPSRHPSLAREVAGIRFPNPIGIAAGFDKDAVAIPALARLGFGYVEVGTLTWHPQPGNPKPRLFRIKEDDALMNRLGFNNEGAQAAAERIERWRARGKVQVPLGINVGRSKIVSNEDAAADYEKSIDALHDLADYMVINVSSPNTPGLRDLQAEDALAELLDVVMAAVNKHSAPKPVFLKIAPDLDDEGAVVAGRLARERALAGLIISNTTISREGLTGTIPEGSGGISGRPLYERSTELLALVKKELPELAYIGVGGVMGPDEVRGKLEAGADLVQVYSGFIYGGPRFPRALCAALRSDQ
jgi:dihydroorotate dehydrogenase